MFRFLTIASLLLVTQLWAQTPVANHGRLSVSNAQIRNQHGNPVQLRGLSFFWSQWDDGAPFYNASVVDFLANNWNVSLVRASMAVDQGGYLTNPGEADKVRRVVNAAIANGIYVIIDWHTHAIHTSAAVTFFQNMAREFGNHPNVIYEIFNEPINQTWAEVKAYSQTVVNAIRAIDPDNLIIIGSPTWSQDVHIAAADPVPGTNLAYALHFYAGTHEAWLRTQAQTAIGLGQAIFVTEWGTTHSDGGTADRRVYTAESTTWLNWMDARNISWANWSITAKDEASAILRPGASTTGGWTDANLTESGRFVRDRLLSYPSVRARLSSSSVAVSSSSVATGGSGQLDAYGEWGVYVDSLGSTVRPPQGQSPLTGTGSAQRARADMNVVAEPEWVEGVELEYPFVGMFVMFPRNGVLSTSNSITLTYRSSGDIRMAFFQTGISEAGGELEGQEWGYHLFPASTTSNTVTIPFSSLEQPTWVETLTTFNRNQVYGIKWELRPTTAGPVEGFIEINNISFDGYTSIAPTSEAALQPFSAQLRGRNLHLNGVGGRAELLIMDSRGQQVWKMQAENHQSVFALPESVGRGWRKLIVRSDAGVSSQSLLLME